MDKPKLNSRIRTFGSVTFSLLIVLAISSGSHIPASFAASQHSMLVTVDNDVCGNHGCHLVPVQGAQVNSTWFVSPHSGPHPLPTKTTGSKGTVTITFPDSATGLRIKVTFPMLPHCKGQVDRIRDPDYVSNTLFVVSC